MPGVVARNGLVPNSNQPGRYAVRKEFCAQLAKLAYRGRT